ncbi:MAG TPA: ATP-binding protein [Bryobacteraceae bacterium]
MSWKNARRFRFVRTLRFRIASTLIVVLAAILAVVGLAGTVMLRHILETQSEQTLHEELGALKGGWIYFDPQSGEPYWFADRTDPETEAEISLLEDVYVIADSTGKVHLSSVTPGLTSIYQKSVILSELKQIEQTHQAILKTVTGSDGTPYQIISSTLYDNNRHHIWYVAEGRSLAGDRLTLRHFSRNIWIFIPIILGVCGLIGWYSAARSLRSLQSVEKAAQAITGSNLGLQIPKRGAEDELDRLIDSFNAMSGRLKASFEQVRQFSTDVSHELRTPLTAIQGQLEVALFTATRKEQLQEAVENALQDVERLSNLIRALLLLSQSESGQVPMNKTVLDLTGLAGEIVEQFQIPAEANGIKLVLRAPQPVLCEVDRTQIERLVTNLLANAVKYTPAGGWASVRVEKSGANVHLIVEDSGAGIPQDHLSHIFNRFYRVPDTSPEKGLGLGLSFVAAIVRAHGGEVQVESEVGKGSRFDIILPVGNVPVAAEITVAHGQ